MKDKLLAAEELQAALTMHTFICPTNVNEIT